MSLGAFSFVLHTHMPFYRGAGRWPHGEENLHEVMAESYVPILEALTDLLEAGVPAKLSIGITPVLAEQLADPLIISNFVTYLGQEIEAAAGEVKRFEQSGNQHFLYLSRFYLQWYGHVLQQFQERFGSNIPAAFRRLQDAGMVEILTSAATHAYLPLMERDSTIYGQLALGKQVTMKHFGREPRAIWLPECAYRPAYYVSGPDGVSYERPGIEHWLEQRGLGLFFSESNAVEGSSVIAQAQRSTREVFSETSMESAGSDIYGQVARVLREKGYRSAGFVSEKTRVPFQGGEARQHGGTYEAYYVRDSDTAVLGRNRVVGSQVWSADFGYPGDASYREFHKKDPQHGFQYWRVTEGKPDLGYKQPYDPYRAGQKSAEHASHFAALVEGQLQFFKETRGHEGYIAAAYDTELFGHWWFEGVSWLKEVLTRLASSEQVQLQTPSDWLEGHTPERAIDLPESSWGHEGTHITWINPDTTWMWDAIHTCEARMESLVARYPRAEGETLAALNQAARELVLLEASDWEFLYTTWQARQYASDRFSEHVDRFNDLAAALEAPDAYEAAPALAHRYGERDNLFAEIDYRLFSKQQAG